MNDGEQIVILNCSKLDVMRAPILEINTYCLLEALQSKADHVSVKDKEVLYRLSHYQFKGKLMKGGIVKLLFASQSDMEIFLEFFSKEKSILFFQNCKKPTQSVIRKMKKDLEDEKYLNGLIEKASPNWKGIDAEEWLNVIRGNYEE